MYIYIYIYIHVVMYIYITVYSPFCVCQGFEDSFLKTVSTYHADNKLNTPKQGFSVQVFYKVCKGSSRLFNYLSVTLVFRRSQVRFRPKTKNSNPYGRNNRPSSKGSNDCYKQ